MTDTDPPTGSEGLAADHGTAARPEQPDEEHRESAPESDSDPGSDSEQVTVPLQERDVTERGVFSTLMGERRSVAEIVRGSEFEIERRYWIQPPHVYVAILQHTEAAEYLYYVVEPELDEYEHALLETLFEDYVRAVAGEVDDRVLGVEGRTLEGGEGTGGRQLDGVGEVGVEPVEVRPGVRDRVDQSLVSPLVGPVERRQGLLDGSAGLGGRRPVTVEVDVQEDLVARQEGVPVRVEYEV